MKNRESNLRILRTERGLTQQQLADAIGCTLKTIQQYEKACAGGVPTSGMDFGTVSSLADFFGVSIDYVIGRSNCRSVDNEYIHQKTGLSDASIKNLGRIKKCHEDADAKIGLLSVISGGYVDMTPQNGTQFDAFNAFLSSEYLQDFIYNLCNLLHTEYNRPKIPIPSEMHKKVNRQKRIDPNDGFAVAEPNKNGTSCVFLCNENNFADTKMLLIDKPFLKAVALNGLHEFFSTFEREYKKAHKKKGV